MATILGIHIPLTSRHKDLTEKPVENERIYLDSTEDVSHLNSAEIARLRKAKELKEDALEISRREREKNDWRKEGKRSGYYDGGGDRDYFNRGKGDL